MEFILAIGVFVLWVMVLRLSNRVEQLDLRLRNQGVPVSQLVPMTAPSTPQPEPLSFASDTYLLAVSPSVIADPQTSPSPLQPLSPFTPVAAGRYVQPLRMDNAPHSVSVPTEFFLVSWFKEQTLIKVGALIFFLGAVWFVSYAISENWISPALRIVLGLALALSISTIGHVRARQDTTQYLVLTTLGTGVWIATIFTAQFLFGLFNPLVALTLLVMAIVYTVLVSVATTTEWLALVSGIAGMVAPQLVGSTQPDPLFFQLYLLVLTAGFLSVVFFTYWRTVTLLFIVGISIFQINLFGLMPLGEQWWFVVLFSSLFFLSTTVSLLRARVPEVMDIGTLGLVSFLYISFAARLPVFDAVAVFVAAVVVAAVGYVAHLRPTPPRVVAVFACFSGLAWMIGTSLLLSGYSLLLALTIEIAVAFGVLTYLNLSRRAIVLAAALYLIPVFASVPVLFSAAWEQGVFHLDALAATVVAIALLGSMLWVLERPQSRLESWALPVAGYLGALGFLYTLVLLAQIGVAVLVPDPVSGTVFTYVLWAGFSAVSMYYVITAALPSMWVTAAVVSLILPVTASLNSFVAPSWSRGVLQADAVGVYGVLALLSLVLYLLGTWYKRTGDVVCRRYTGLLLVGTVGYSFLVIAAFWNALLAPMASTATVMMYVSYALVMYGVIGALWRMRSPFPWVYIATLAGAIPLTLTIESLSVANWQGSILHPHASGLYAVTALVCLIAVRFATYRTDDTVIAAQVRSWAIALFAITGFYATALVWLCAHALSATGDIAVTVALFIYTVVGLGLYVMGSRNSDVRLRYAGMVLLIIVVLRLGLVEVWTMDILWRIVTFLGIGFLFMVAALIQKKS